MNPIFLDLLICRKALKSLTDRRHLLLVTSSNHLLTSSKPFPKCVLDCKYPPSLKFYIILTFHPTDLEQFLRAI